MAVLGGLIGLFIADAHPGGLSGGEGFLVGFTLVMMIAFILIIYLLMVYMRLTFYLLRAAVAWNQLATIPRLRRNYRKVRWAIAIVTVMLASAIAAVFIMIA